jgi:hypothetical protein
LLGEALRGLKSGQKAEVVIQDYQRKRREELMIQAAVTDFRLFWDALASALAGREKVIIDADRVPGKRQLLLLDPDLFKVPVPFLAPSRGSGNESHGEGP